MNKLVVLLACAAGWTTASSTSLTAKPCDYCNAQMRERYSVYGDCSTLMLLYALAPTLDEQVASGRAYVQRVRDQLATVLYEDQFPVFDQMQQELLSDMRQVLKEERNPER